MPEITDIMRSNKYQLCFTESPKGESGQGFICDRVLGHSGRHSWEIHENNPQIAKLDGTIFDFGTLLRRELGEVGRDATTLKQLARESRTVLDELTRAINRPEPRSVLLYLTDENGMATSGYWNETLNWNGNYFTLPIRPFSVQIRVPDRRGRVNKNSRLRTVDVPGVELRGHIR